jgi:hypothetical protein
VAQVQLQRVETEQYIEGFRRQLRALTTRVAEGDIESLRTMVELRDEFEAGITEAIRGLRNDADLPMAWSQIAEALGMSMRNVIRRYNHVGGLRQRGGQPGNWR